MPPAPTLSATLGALCALPLFLAPLLAGMTLAPTALLPVFVAVWLVWLMAARPAGWRRRARIGTALGALWMQVLGHALLVALLFAIGRGFAVLLGNALPLPVWIAVALALAALPLTRLAARLPALDGAGVPADQGKAAGSRA